MTKRISKQHQSSQEVINKNKSLASSFGVLNPLNSKFRCLQAWCLLKLEQQEEQEAIAFIGNQDFLNKHLAEIKDIIKSKGNTYEIMEILGRRDLRIPFYYNNITKTLDKYFKLGDSWIPSMLVLSALQEYTLRGYTGFENIPFNDLLAEMELDTDKDTRFKHYRCAYDIVENLVKYKALKRK